jgi:hypothetical protein
MVSLTFFGNQYNDKPQRQSSVRVRTRKAVHIGMMLSSAAGIKVVAVEQVALWLLVTAFEQA